MFVLNAIFVYIRLEYTEGAIVGNKEMVTHGLGRQNYEGLGGEALEHADPM